MVGHTEISLNFRLALDAVGRKNRRLGPLNGGWGLGKAAAGHPTILEG